MEIQKGFSLPHVSHEDIIDYLETCALCGTRLNFSHQTDYLKLEVHEEAKCGACGIKTKVNMYVLQ